jgi:TatD DNase family protein
MTAAAPAIRGFDFHCHLDLYPDPQRIFERCRVERIVTLAVTTTPKAWRQNVKWAAGNPFVIPSVGLHPELVGERFQELPLLEHLVAESRFLGELGLDGSPQHQKSVVQQREILTRTLSVAHSKGGRLVSLHSRRAEPETLSIIRKVTTRDKVLCILHWYSGSINVAQQAVAAGCYFSINHRMLESDRGRTLVKALPDERLLTETDGPFTMIDRRPTAPPDVIFTTEMLAKLRSTSLTAMTESLHANAMAVLRFAGLSAPMPEKHPH